MDVLASKVIGVFAHIERADQHRALRFQLFDQRRVMLRRRQLAVDLGAGTRREARNIEQVLHRERHARQWAQRLAGGMRDIERFRARQRALGGDVSEGVEHLIASADRGERGFHHGLYADLAARHGAGDLMAFGESPVGHGQVS
jgi:hypothetical protein